MTKMPVNAQIVLSLVLLTALVFLISAVVKLTELVARKLFGLWTALLNGAAEEIP